MTVPRTTKKKDVERTYKSLERAYLTEDPDYPADRVYIVYAIPEPRRGTRAHVIWVALRTAFATQARYRVRDLLKASERRGQRLAVLDDKRRTEALRNLNRAWVLTRSAADLLQENANIVAAEVHMQQDDLLAEIAKVAAIAAPFEPLIAELNQIRGITPLRTQREWDLFISETATQMRDVGFSSREICGILTGTKAEKVDRATLERFRQRVRRQLDPVT